MRKQRKTIVATVQLTLELDKGVRIKSVLKNLVKGMELPVICFGPYSNLTGQAVKTELVGFVNS